MRVLTTLLLLTLCACAATNAEKESAMRGAIDCFRRAVRTMDDRQSDAATVGVGVLATCSSEANQAIEVAGQGMPYGAYLNFKRRMEAINLETATAVVLQERAAR